MSNNKNYINTDKIINDNINAAKLAEQVLSNIEIPNIDNPVYKQNDLIRETIIELTSINKTLMEQKKKLEDQIISSKVDSKVNRKLAYYSIGIAAASALFGLGSLAIALIVLFS